MKILPGVSINFLTQPDDIQRAYLSSWDVSLVLASIFIAVFASFCAFEIVGHLSNNRQRRSGILLGTTLLGAGIWAMHFVGMIAFRLNCSVSYDPYITMLSMIPGMLASGLALLLITSKNFSRVSLVTGGVALGCGIGLMHYSGMAAIRLDGYLRYDPEFFALSLFAAIVLSIMSLWCRTVIQGTRFGEIPYVASATAGTILGLSVSSIHYIAMKAAYFLPDGGAISSLAISNGTLAVLIIIIVFLLLASGLLLTSFYSKSTLAYKRIEAILDTTQQGFLLCDPNRIIQETNQALLSMLGTDQKRLIGSPLENFMANPDDLAKMQGTFQCVLMFKCADGQTLPCLANGSAVYNQEGKTLYSFLLISDISPRVEAEARLQAQALELNAIFNAASSGIVLLKDRAIQRCNRKLHEILGYTSQQLAGQSTRIWFPDDITWEEAGRQIYAHIWEGGVHSHEVQLMHLDGSLFWARVSGQAVDVNDKAKGSVWIIDDITLEREAKQALLEAKDMAEAATRVKSHFLANMSHEIRTPMNAIIGMSHLAFKTSRDPRQRDYLYKIQQSSHHLLGLINDILDFSKIEAGKLTLEQAPFNLMNVLDSVSNLIQEKAAEKGLEIIFDIPANLPEALIGDSLRLGQILINFCTNAVKFTERGEIVVSIYPLEQTEKEILLKFAVKDSGIGLTEEQASQLFQSFQQADTSTTRKHGGTGLGLAISKNLSELMGGQVGVDSVAGQGSTFWFTARLGMGDENRRQLLPDPDLRGKRVLVVDDHETARTVLVDMLTTMSFDVSAVASGAAAITAVRDAARSNHCFDLVYLDWRMPELDGIATACKIRELGLSQEPKFLLVTAYGREEILKCAEESGIEIDHIVFKPVNPSTLFDSTMRALSLSTARGSTPAVGPSAPEQRLATLSGARILVVEDNDLNQQVAKELLEDAGFIVNIAENGAEALAKLHEQTYDLVLMDMQMPVLDGIAATRAIRLLPEFAGLPVVAMTANAMQQDRDNCLAAGMNDHLAKPIDPEDLWLCLLKWIPARNTASTPGSPAKNTADAPGYPSLDISGLDSATGLKRVLGKRPVYEALLRKFVNGQQDVAERILAALDASDWLSAERLAHTLKGVAGNIGASVIQAEAGKLETALQEKAGRQNVEAILARISPVLAEIILAIQAVLKQDETDESAQDPGTLRTVLTELLSLLNKDSAESVSYFESHAQLLSVAFPLQFIMIAKNINNFDFEQAAMLLEEAAGIKGINY